MNRLRNATVCAESYGCTYNHADTEKLLLFAEQSMHIPVFQK